MLVIVVTVSVVVVSVIVLVVIGFVALVLLLESDGHSSLLPGCHVKPAFFLQLSSGLVPLRFHLSQSSSNKLLLWWVKGRWSINPGNSTFLELMPSLNELCIGVALAQIWNIHFGQMAK